MVGVILALGCTGLFGDGEGSFAEEAVLDAADPVEAMRERGDFAGAESVLRERLNANPEDARSWRLYGDLCFSRGQRYHQRWKENLAWAREYYTRSLTVDPTSCVTWGRLSVAIVAASENETIATPREELDALPLARGWESCPSAALAEIELQRTPTDDEFAAAASATSGGEFEVRAAAAPWQLEALRRVGLETLKWRPAYVAPEPGPDSTYVVLDLPVRARGVAGAKPRSFTYGEWLTVRRVDGEGRLVYLDRRFPERVPARGLTQATACEGTKWDLDGPDRVAVGTCVAGPQSRGASAVYDPALLRTAGVAHFHHPDFNRSMLDWSGIASDSVMCLGGPVGRMFVDVPSCQVAYDQAIPQTRSVPGDVGVTAVSREHGDKMVNTARSVPLLGPVAADKLARGDVALGMPYSLFAMSQPDVTGCRGRGVYTKSTIEDDGVGFSCTVGQWTYSFRELALVDLQPSSP